MDIMIARTMMGMDVLMTSKGEPKILIKNVSIGCTSS